MRKRGIECVRRYGHWVKYNEGGRLKEEARIKNLTPASNFFVNSIGLFLLV